MEMLKTELSAVNFDKAVHGGLDGNPVLAEAGDLAIYAKPNATVNGNGMVVVTFTVRLPNGQMARAQAVTTSQLFAMSGAIVKGWNEAGVLGRAAQN